MDLFKRLHDLNIISFIKRWRLMGLLLGAADIIALALAYQLAYFLNYRGFFPYNPQLFKLFLLILPFWLLILYFLDVTEIPRTKRYRVLFWEYLQSASIILVILLVFYFVLKLDTISRRLIVEFAFFGFIFLFVTRLTEYKVFKIYRAKGFNFINTVLIADELSIPFIDTLIRYKEWGYRISLIYSGSQKVKEKYAPAIEVLPEKSVKSLYDLMEIEPIDEVMYVKDKIVPLEVRQLIRSCEELGVVFRLMHKESSLNLTNAVNTTIGPARFLTFTNIPHNQYALAVKKLIDIFGAILAIILFSPFMLLISLSIFLTFSGPVIFRQKRIGLRGRPFEMYKFRTMISHADELKEELVALNEMDGPAFKIKDDPRITRVGKFLRRTGLDELPQLFNVLKGEMSLIGPRPMVEEEAQQYKRWQLRRLSVKPGLSCFWQVRPERNAIKFEKWMEMDLAYIDNWSLRLDFIILIKTIKTIFQRSGM